MGYVQCNSLPQSVLSLPTYKTASSSMTTFNTDMTENLISCVADIPSGGASEINVFRCSKNLIENKKVQQSTQAVVIGWDAYTNIGKTYLKAGTYTFSADMSDTGVLMVRVGGSSPYSIKNFNNTGHVSVTFTLSENNYCRFYIYKASGFSVDDITNFMIEQSDHETAYEVYNGNTYNVQFGSTILGGTFDVITGKIIDGSDNVSYVNSVEIPTLNGTNNVYADTGDIDTCKYILSVSEALRQN